MTDLRPGHPYPPQEARGTPPTAKDLLPKGITAAFMGDDLGWVSLEPDSTLEALNYRAEPTTTLRDDNFVGHCSGWDVCLDEDEEEALHQEQRLADILIATGEND